MQKIIFVLIPFAFDVLCGQMFTTGRQYSAPKYSKEIKGNAELEVVYNTTTSNGGKTITSQTLLQTGKGFSKFIDVNTIKRDSLIERHSYLPSVGAKELNELGLYNIYYKKSVLKDVLANVISVQERIWKNVYQYQEISPKQNWILTNEQKMLLGYLCKSAKASFRGRNYTAWYTEDISISDGPYIFGGLPGLILEIEDETGTYGFTAVSIEKSKREIYWRNENTIMFITRDEFRKLHRNYFENPSIFLTGKAYDESGREIAINNSTKFYNPLELE